MTLDHQRVDALVDDLLRTHDPVTTPPREFWGAQFDRGLGWVQFPPGHGGLGLAPALQEAVDERLEAAGAPSNALINFVGLGTAGPAIVAFGTEAHKHRFLRPLFTCDEVWCQLFSEPGAGSDLGNASTLAERDGDEWVINGHKVWTTLAHVATFGILVARTHPELPKHRGLTFFLVDMRSPGVDVRPLRQISGEAEFNEVFLTDVRVPDSMRIGEPGEGWRVTIGALMHERSHNADLAKRPRGMGPIAHAVRLWRELGIDDPARRDELTRIWIEAEVIRLTSIRAEQTRRSGTPGPEGSAGKLATGVLPQRIFEFCMGLLGPRGMLISDYVMRQPDRMFEGNMGDGTEPVEVSKAFLNSRSATIGGGTTEIQKNTIAERVLGLPKEPRPDRDVPWLATQDAGR
ncbi:MAG TPA: acyl-CoA dehydrogenase family protein [Acidimicrobiales bacterium]|jgi:alkylation response protein AidB-like acyl-CoA dehydrogenase|nr:acyl-CoA dehydrogenase family protein [Acidimicrobiales bacterium]